MISREILGIKVDFGLNLTQVLDLVDLYMKDDVCRYICTVNPEFIMDAQEDGRFKHIINNADLSLPDGSGVVFARHYLNKIKNIERNKMFPLKAFFAGLSTGLTYGFLQKNDERITGVDLTYKLCELASKRGYTVFFLGGRARNWLGKHIQIDKDIAQESADEMIKNYPGLKVIGATSKFSREERDDEATLSYIKSCMRENNVTKVDIIFVAYNHNKQEKWIVRNSQKIPARLSIGVGGTFDYIIGQNTLPPRFLEKVHLGWLFRLIIQPWRVKRISKAFPYFPLKVYIESLKK